MVSDDEIGRLQEAALKRKQWLQELRNKNATASGSDSTGACGEPLPSAAPLFRSYIPKDESLKAKVIPRAKTLKVEDQVQDEIEATKSKPVIEDLDLSNLAPRKPDWDLKRDVSRKLEKLEKRTQRAIVELIRERLSRGSTDFLTTLNMGAEIEAKPE